MRYIDSKTEKILSSNDLAKRGLNAETAHLAGVFPIEEIRPEYNPDCETIRPGSVKKTDAGYVRHWEIAWRPLPYVKDWKKAQATAIRWDRETGGIILPNGTRILTGIDDQNRISTAIQGMRDNGMTEVDFKAASGWVKLSLDQMLAVAGAIAEHVQGCFSNERRLHEAIDAAQSLDELNAIDLEEGWPEYASVLDGSAPEVA